MVDFVLLVFVLAVFVAGLWAGRHWEIVCKWWEQVWK